jgi:predicted metalloendopeptidase
LQYGEKEWWKKQEEEALERRTSMLVKTFNSKDFHIQYVDKKLND